MAVLYCLKDMVLHMEVSWCAVYMYWATTCAPEDLDDSVIWRAKRCFELLEHTAFLAGDGNVPLLGK